MRRSLTRLAVGRAPRLEGKAAVVTGAGGGIGRNAAELFAREGAKVLCADLDGAAAEAVAKRINEQVGCTVAIGSAVDVAQASAVEQMVAMCESEFGSLNVLFNNAGLMHMADDDAVGTDEAVWDLTMNVNVKGVWFGCKFGIPAMRRAGGGSIINTASFVSLRGAATPQLAYTSSKGAVLAMSRELAVIHAREGIRVNALCPGPLNTPLLQDFLDSEEKKQRRLVHVPMGRFGEAAEMAKAALFLASSDSSYVTGTEFMVDGGICAAYVTPDAQVDPFDGPTSLE